MSEPYADILHHVRPESRRHPRMSIADRAAQFAPFAALSGYGSAVAETARFTAEKIELEESAKAELDAKLRLIRARLAERPEVTVTHFCADDRKSGGVYRDVTGEVVRFLPLNTHLVMADGTQIALDDILTIRGDWLPEWGGWYEWEEEKRAD